MSKSVCFESEILSSCFWGKAQSFLDYIFCIGPDVSKSITSDRNGLGGNIPKRAEMALWKVPGRLSS